MSIITYSSVVKSGCRFVDEMAEFQIKASEDGQTMHTSLFLKEAEEDTAEVKKKQQAVKASFKIELKDEERKVRDA